MIYCKRAKKEDYLAISELLKPFGERAAISPDYLNNKDLAIQARDSETGAVIGFVWCGVMANGSIGYLDKFVVDLNYAKKGVGNMLAHYMLKEMTRRKIKTAFGMIRHDKFHDNSAMNALKMAMGSDGFQYTYVSGQVARSVAELNSVHKLGA